MAWRTLEVPVGGVWHDAQVPVGVDPVGVCDNGDDMDAADAPPRRERRMSRAAGDGPGPARRREPAALKDFRPARARPDDGRCGPRAPNWRTVSTTPDTPSAPETPAATLLFQAPTFQAPAVVAPEPEEPGSGRSSRRRATGDESPDQPTRSRRRGRGHQRESASEDASSGPEDRTHASSDADSSDAQASGGPSHGSDGDEAAATTEASESAPAPTRSRKKRGSGRRGRDHEPETQKGTDAAVEAPGGQPEKPEHTGQDAGESPSSPETSEDDAETGRTRRRRRRRSRSGSGSDESDGENLSGQVKALKGSTRLEAKKQRRKEGRREGRRRHVITEAEFLARRESVDRQMVIRHLDGLDQIAVLEDDLLVEHYVARHTQQSAVGNIYLGRVQNVLPSMEAAFIDIGRGRNAVLYAGEVNWDAVGLDGRPRRIESALKSGDSVLVQVTKDPIGHKGARLTSQITLAGRYLVLIPGGSMMGISRKLPENERQRLKKILKKAVPHTSGVIVRTAAEGATEEQIADDVARLTRQWADIEKKQSATKSAPKLLRGEPELAVRVVRDIFNEDFASLTIEGKETWETVSHYVEELSPELSDRVHLWTGTDDVFHAHRIDEQLTKGMDRKVWLPSGGTLIIDRTEAMTVIDVNTGKYIGKGGTLEETVTRNNLEAAEEIVRQLRLRDIGGIIIVDFVDMVLEPNRDLVLRRLVECLGRDRTRHQVTEITSLGLVQMTRKRVGEGLVEAFSTPCEVCEGRGFIVHDHPVEHSGGDAGSERSGGRRSRKSAESPRRIEDGPGRERAREAVSAIAAASGHSHASGDEGVPGADTPVAAPSVEEPVEEPSVPDKPARTSRSRRRRAVSAGAVDTERPTPPAIELPAPQEPGPVAHAVHDLAEVVLPAPADVREDTQGGEEQAEPAGDGGRTRPRRRRAATASVVEPRVAAPSESAATTAGSADAHRPATVEEIALPTTHTPVRRARRRRVATAGVVEAGETEARA